MGYRQPRVPEYREKEGVEAYLKTLVFFLKDFALAAWSSDNRRGREIKEMKARIEALENAAQAAGEEVT